LFCSLPSTRLFPFGHTLLVFPGQEFVAPFPYFVRMGLFAGNICSTTRWAGISCLVSPFTFTLTRLQFFWSSRTGAPTSSLYRFWYHFSYPQLFPLPPTPLFPPSFWHFRFSLQAHKPTMIFLNSRLSLDFFPLDRFDVPLCSQTPRLPPIFALKLFDFTGGLSFHGFSPPKSPSGPPPLTTFAFSFNFLERSAGTRSHIGLFHLPTAARFHRVSPFQFPPMSLLDFCPARWR